MTALEASFIGSGLSLTSLEMAKAAFRSVAQIENGVSGKEDLDPLEVRYWGLDFMNWNNAAGRTKEEVLQALSKASSLAEEKDDQE